MTTAESAGIRLLAAVRTVSFLATIVLLVSDHLASSSTPSSPSLSSSPSLISSFTPSSNNSQRQMQAPFPHSLHHQMDQQPADRAEVSNVPPRVEVRQERKSRSNDRITDLSILSLLIFPLKPSVNIPFPQVITF